MVKQKFIRTLEWWSRNLPYLSYYLYVCNISLQTAEWVSYEPYRTRRNDRAEKNSYGPTENVHGPTNLCESLKWAILPANFTILANCPILKYLSGQFTRIPFEPEQLLHLVVDVLVMVSHFF